MLVWVNYCLAKVRLAYAVDVKNPVCDVTPNFWSRS